MQLPISNIINISVIESPVGISAFNTSNLAIFSSDVAGEGFGTDGYKIYFTATDVAIDFGTDSNTYKMALGVFSQQPNILSGGGYLVVILLEPSETLDAAITRTQGLVQYFGIMSTQIENQTNMLAAAAVVQSLNAIAFFVQTSSATVVEGGSLDLLRQGNFTQSRGLYYGGTTVEALVMMASYAGRGLSVNFAGSNTTLNMQLKQLAGVLPDASITGTIWTNAQAAGADVYPSWQGTPGVGTSGANDFFDNQYNLQAFIGNMQAAGFNYLLQAATKVPQTEAGMAGLKGAYASVCQQFVSNQYLAPGTWTSPTTFGNQQDLYDNISQYGYYIYSSPIATQLQANRAAREAPLVQIAIKLAGAINTSDVVIYVNP